MLSSPALQGMSAFVSKRLVDSLLAHRQAAAEKAQRELEVGSCQRLVRGWAGWAGRAGVAHA